MTSRVLVVEDDRDEGELLQALLIRRGHGASFVDRPETALTALAEDDVDVVITDVRMAGLSGIELCERVRASHPDVPVIVITGQADVTTAVAALRAGAWDFVTKPLDPDQVELAVARAVEHRRARGEVRRLRQALAATRPVAGIVGDSAPIRAISELINRIADSDATVLVTGESGTGKELVARAVHDLGPRQGEPFVALNCGAVPANLLESELFGHVKGAFTDARRDRPGLFVQAGAGTIFLDEIGEMPLELQVKLLRALQERTVTKVGDQKPEKIDIRVLAATHRDLEAMIVATQFREDLYYRLNVVNLHLPPLRERGEDIVVIAKYLLAKFAAEYAGKVKGFSPDALAAMRKFPWPGNVRQLENRLKKAVVLAEGALVTAADLDLTPAALTAIVPLAQAREEFSRRYVFEVLEQNGGNRTKTAQDLGVDPRTIFRYLEREGPISVESERPPSSRP